MNGKMYIRMLGLSIVLFAGQVYAATQHRVEPNETLSSIAAHYGVTQTALINLNGMPTTHIEVGDILQIPDATLSQQYVIKNGDSLTKVAQNFGVSVVKLSQANNLSPQAEIYAGNRLTIPPIPNTTNTNNSNDKTANATNNNKNSNKLNDTLTNSINDNQNNALNADGKYRVQYGENLTIIAKKYDIPVVGLAKFNHMSLKDKLHFGHVLSIPTKQQLNNLAINTKTVSTSNNSKDNNKSSHSKSYRVKKGDTLLEVADKHGIDFRELARLNNMNYYDHLITGETLKLPVPDVAASVNTDTSANTSVNNSN